MSVNLVILVGNLTRDAEVRTVGQQQVAKFGLATSERFRKQDGTQGERKLMYERREEIENLCRQVLDAAD